MSDAISKSAETIANLMEDDPEFAIRCAIGDSDHGKRVVVFQKASDGIVVMSLSRGQVEHINKMKEENL